MIFDLDFLARLRHRDSAACAAFVFFFTPILEALLRYKINDQAIVEDLRNETLLRALIQVDKDRIRDPKQFGSFVRGICDNVIFEYLRKRKTSSEWPEGFAPADPAPSLEDLLTNGELRQLLRGVLEELSVEDRRLIDAIYLKERDRKSIAREMGISSTGLNVRLCRIMKRLRAAFFGHIEPPPVDRRKTADAGD
jgi:RNA polymerase sigma factor (sigma-70 family)